MSTLSVARLTAEQHDAFVASRPTASFLQTPAWRPQKPEWSRESIGWFAPGRPEPVGAGLVVRRPVPRLDRSFLAYLPEGPLIDWSAPDLSVWLDPMAAYLRSRGAFGIRMGPPVAARRWSATRVKEGLADPEILRFRDLPPSSHDAGGRSVVSHLGRTGWRSRASDDDFGVGQPQFTVEIPLVRHEPDGRRVRLTEDDVLAGMNQLWRRNIRRAAKAGVVVTTVTVDDGAERLRAGLARFHALYVETAQRDGFEPRPPDYFHRMFEAASAEHPDRLRLLLAEHDGDLVAAGVMVRVGGRTWNTYGASSTARREVRGYNALQWAMLRAAIALGAEVHDLRGISPVLDKDDPHVGLAQFKVGTGGQAVECVGEWDLPLRRLLYAAFDLSTRRLG